MLTRDQEIRRFIINKARKDELRGRVLQKLGKAKQFKARGVGTIERAGSRLIAKGDKLIKTSRDTLKKYGAIKPTKVLKDTSTKAVSQVKKSGGKLKKIFRRRKMFYGENKSSKRLRMG